jgi:DNA-binding NarL/FixJ family response regulator
MTKTRILLADDHAIVRLGLMTLLNDQPDMEVVREASTAARSIALATSKIDFFDISFSLNSTPLSGIKASALKMERTSSNQGIIGTLMLF